MSLCGLYHMYLVVFLCSMQLNNLQTLIENGKNVPVSPRVFCAAVVSVVKISRMESYILLCKSVPRSWKSNANLHERLGLPRFARRSAAPASVCCQRREKRDDRRTLDLQSNVFMLEAVVKL